jgi:hypothetical protein
MMEEQVPLLRVNEPEPFVTDDFLDLSLWHFVAPKEVVAQSVARANRLACAP